LQLVVFSTSKDFAAAPPCLLYAILSSLEKMDTLIEIFPQYFMILINFSAKMFLQPAIDKYGSSPN